MTKSPAPDWMRYMLHPTPRTTPRRSANKKRKTPAIHPSIVSGACGRHRVREPAELVYHHLQSGETRAGQRPQIADQSLERPERPRRQRIEPGAGEPPPGVEHVHDQALDRTLAPAVLLAGLGEARVQPGEVDLPGEAV